MKVLFLALVGFLVTGIVHYLCQPYFWAPCLIAPFFRMVVSCKNAGPARTPGWRVSTCDTQHYSSHCHSPAPHWPVITSQNLRETRQSNHRADWDCWSVCDNSESGTWTGFRIKSATASPAWGTRDCLSHHNGELSFSSTWWESWAVA